MKITKALKKWIVDNCEVKADATDDEFRKVASEALVAGTLTPEDYAEYTKDPKEEEANEFSKKLDNVVDLIGGLAKALTPPEKKEEEVKDEKTPEKKEVKETPPVEKQEPSKLDKMMSDLGGTPVDPNGDKTLDIRVKEAAEQYDDTKSTLICPEKTRRGNPHPQAGRPAMSDTEGGRPMKTISQRDWAVTGAFLKFEIAKSARGFSKTFGFQALNQHDKELVLYAMDNYVWDGSTPGHHCIQERKLTTHEKQALIDDAVSGGLEAAPIVFDDDVISAPLLAGELFPRVKTVSIDRGRRIEGVATGNVTMVWGGVDDTTIALFNTAAYVTAFDTTIYRVEGAVRIGLDFLSDSPINFAQHFTNQYGERLLQTLDDVIATGNGATQPLGVMNAAGVTVVAFGGATTLGNYEALRFGVAKPEHGANVKGSAVFCGTETSYSRARGIPVGAADARRLFGMNYDEYSILERPYAINESLTNAQIFYAILGRYRMYRRRGLTFRSSTEGDTLIRRNEMLITVTARFGGQLERGAAAAITITAPA